MSRSNVVSSWCIIIALLSSACATTTTQLAPVAPERVAVEEIRQRELAMRTQWQQQSRLDSIAGPLLRAAVPFCGAAVAPDFGFRFGDIRGVDNRWRVPAQQALGLDEEVRVVAVTPLGPAAKAGLVRGDILRQVGSHIVLPSREAVSGLGKHLSTYHAGTANIPVRVERGGQFLTLDLAPETVCAFSTHVSVDGALNAYADGKAVIITTAMMRFTEDDELAVVVAHEIAHNAMGHIDAMRKNQTAGGLLGLLGDIAMAASGYDTGGYYTKQGLALGAMAFSQDFEREADYVGMYILALAGIEMEQAPTFWRHMAVADPKMIGLAFTHPTSAERFVRMEAAIREINTKRQAGQPLTPEMKK
jgi:beta-barrel assembly-enhancing protease